MIHKDRRRHPRYETKVGVTVYTADIKIDAHMIDISEAGIGVISEKAFEPGAKVFIALELEGNYTIKGTVIWSSSIYDDGENYYRMGIETDCIILKDIKAIGFPERSQLMTQILSEIKEKGIKIVESL